MKNSTLIRMASAAWRVFCVMMILLTTASAVSSVRIHQILYNPMNTNSGGEAVQLYNEGEDAVNLSGWRIATEASDKDVIFGNIVMPAYSYFLVADTGWETMKDNAEWQQADFTDTITMANTDSGIALIDGAGTVIDAVGWGAAAGINEGLFMGVPAANTKKGNSLLRVLNTGNNSNDFIETTPQFINNSVFILAVFGSEESGKFRIIQDDSSAEGVQLLPSPGKERLVKVRGTRNATLMRVFGKEFKIEKINDGFEGEFSIPYHSNPQKYTLEIELNEGIDELEFEVMPLASLHVLTQYVDFVNAPFIKVKNAGNLALEVKVPQKGVLKGKNNETIEIASSGVPLFLAPGEESTGEVKLVLPESAKIQKGNYIGAIEVRGEKK